MQEAFDGLSKTVGSEYIRKWSKYETEAMAEGGIGKQIYEAKVKKRESSGSYNIIQYNII